jgi:oligoribonuclease NrnB/cAMP/cGMP phosphodiesterase (DHH superfamily)
MNKEMTIKGGQYMPFRSSVMMDMHGNVSEVHNMNDWIKDTKTRVLNITHDDLDGAVAGIVVRNVYTACITVRTNYSGQVYRDAIDAIAKPETYDAIIFSDFSPDDNMIDAVHAVRKPYLVIDHHQTAIVRPDDPYGEYFVKEGRCGALLCYDYFKDMADLEKLYQLCVVTNDHDLWLRKMIPISDDLNTLLYEYGYEEFMTKFMNGLELDGSLPEDARAILANHEHEVDEYIAQCVQHELPYNGHYIECDRFNSDINMRMTPQYDWLVMAGTEGVDPGMTKLSFRTRRKDINIGRTLKEFGRGGGGHPAAAGQIIPTVERDEFIQQVGDKLFSGK